MSNKKAFFISRILFLLLLCALCLDSTQMPLEQAEQGRGRELIDMSIEELMEVPVTCDSDSTPKPITETALRGIEHA